MTRIALVLFVASLAYPAAAQDITWARDAPPAWLGMTYDLRWVETGATCASRVLVEGVVPGSPAERAGLRPGDLIVAIDGDGTPARRLQLLSLRLAPGDSVRLRLQRGGSTREVTAVADLRPARPPSLPRSPAVPDRGRDAPVVHVRGDTLMATNMDARISVVRARPPGYWLSHDDGRTVFHPLSARPRSDLDRRVASLLSCADSAGSLVPAMGVQVERIQERAESLRVVIARRALEGRDGEAQLRLDALRSMVPGTRPPTDGGRIMIFQAEEALAASLRGVNGADVVAMEPELAAYFRGVDEGLLVLRVAEGSPAHRGGLRAGDVITAAAGRAVATPSELRATLAAPGAGAVDLAIVRQGRQRTVSLPRR